MNWFLLAFISAVFSAAAAVSEKKALFKLNALDFSFIVSLVTLLFTLPFFFGIQYSLIFKIEILILFIKTIFGAAAFLFVMKAIKNLEISEALPLLALTPGFVAVAGVLFINDSLKPTEWAAILLMLAGAYILEIQKGKRKLTDPFKTLSNFTKYAYVFSALALFTISSVLDRVLLTDYKLPPYTFTAMQQLFYALIFAVVFFFKQGNPMRAAKGLDRQTFYLITTIAILTVIYRYTQIEATKLAPAALVLSVKRLSVLLAVIFGGKLFRDENLKVRIAAVIVILAGTTLLMIN